MTDRDNFHRDSAIAICVLAILIAASVCSAVRGEESLLDLGVRVTVDAGTTLHVGSGVVIDQGVLTAYHCVDGHEEVLCVAQGEAAIGTVTHWDADSDIALLHVQWINPKKSAVLASQEVTDRSTVWSVGRRTENGKMSIVQHTVLLTQPTSKVKGHWHNEAVVHPCFNHGRSGGGLFDRDGKLVGIVTSAEPKVADPRGFATTVKEIKQLLYPETK